MFTMYLPAKAAMNCFQQINMKSLTSAVFRHSLETLSKRSLFSAPNLLHYSKQISHHRQNSLIRNGSVVACLKSKHGFVQIFLPHFPKNFSSATEKAGIQKNISALQAKKRIPRKRSTVDTEQQVGKNKWLVVAYSSAEEYDLCAASREIEKQGVYKILPLPEDAGEVLHVSANYQVGREPRHIYFFSEGTVVFWNIPDLEQQSVLEFLKPFQVNAYDENIFKEEREDLEYVYGENGTKLSNGLIVLNRVVDAENLEAYAFSNGMALSVKLALWEATLESFVDSIEWVTENMKCGKKVHMSREQVFQKRGELFALRHVINLSSDLLDTPDFYWDRHNLEILYQQTCNHLNIAKRTKVMNERLNYCSELIDLLGNHMNDKHHVRLEQMIIALIMIEVMFECAHFFS